MSASRILEKIQRKGQITNVAKRDPTQLPGQGSQNSNFSRSPSFPSLVSPPGERVIDPVVARLKAARKAEKEQKEKELREKKGLPPKKEKSANPRKLPQNPPARSGALANRGAVGSKNRADPRASMGSRGPISRPGLANAAEKKPKMSFSELMAKASGIDQLKMSIGIKNKAKSPETSAPSSRRRGLETDPRKTGRQRPVSQNAGKSSHAMDERRMPKPIKRPVAKGPASRPPPVQKPVVASSRAPLPVRKPSSALAAKLGQKSNAKSAPNNRMDDLQDEGEYESDMDSFIASEDEEELQQEQDFDRDEIWSIFNRGKKRSHYAYDDYESDDMEATGAEIFEEESRSKRDALLEDKREMEKEAKLAAIKRARKMGGGR